MSLLTVYYDYYKNWSPTLAHNSQTFSDQSITIMSLNTDNPHVTITQPPQGKDMMSLALPYCVSELPTSRIDEDATPSMMSHALPRCVSKLPTSGINEDTTLSRKQGLTATHSPSDTIVAVAMDDELKEFNTMVSVCSYCVPL
jgi:hypothetical protein